MKIAVYSKQHDADTLSFIGKVMNSMRLRQVEVYVYADLLPLFDKSCADVISG